MTEGTPQPVENTGEQGAITAVGRGLIYVQGDVVFFEVPNLGCMELAPDVAESVGRALLAGAKLVRESKPKQIVKLHL